MRASWLASMACIPVLWACNPETPEKDPGNPVSEPDPGAPWRSFEVVTRVDVPDSTGVTRAWIPVPRTEETDHQRGAAPTWEGNAATVELRKDPSTGAEYVYAEWAAGETAPELTVTSRVETRDRAVDLEAAPSGATLSDGDRQLYLSPSDLIPVDGIVLEYAVDIAGAEESDIAKARALYEWIVENTERDPAVQGCGTGDIANMLETGTLSGKCVDLNALFVGMARALGIPARHDYGIRVTESATYQSLGKEGDITKGQHCRAEFWAEGYGWVPVDPADVRKLVLEENGGTPLEDPLVQQARETLFGAAEMNWVVYNHAEDIALPSSSVGSLPFLMYPQIEVGGELCNCYLPETCSYTIESAEIDPPEVR